MDELDLVDCTLPGTRPGWSVRLTHGGATKGTEPARVRMEGAGPGVRHLRWSAGEAVVVGAPRPAVVPGTGAPDPDPALALLSAVEESGVSGLRRMEGPWALLRWDAQREELLVAVDRLGRQDIYARRDADGWSFADSAAPLIEATNTPFDSSPQVRAEADADAAADGAAGSVLRLQPGQHWQLRRDGSRHLGKHGSWQVERRDRRPPVLVVGEFEERLKSALRELAEHGELVILVERAEAGLVLSAALAQLSGCSATLLFVAGLSDGGPEFWRNVSTHFQFSFELAGTLASEATPAGVAGEAAWSALSTWCRRAERGTAGRTIWLLSSAGFDLALPPAPPAWRHSAAWRAWRSDAPPQPGLIGERLAQALRTKWKPRLDAALADSCLQPAWPMLDETVSHFLANLTDRLRWGAPWSRDFRRRVLRDLVPPALRTELATLQRAPGAAD